MKTINQVSVKSPDFTEYFCVLCRRDPPRTPIQLICAHFACTDCGKALQRKEVDRYMQPHQKISCPSCLQTTLFEDIKYLQIISPSIQNLKIGSKESLINIQESDQEASLSRRVNSEISLPTSIYSHHNNSQTKQISPQRQKEQQSKQEILTYGQPKKDKVIEEQNKNIVKEELSHRNPQGEEKQVSYSLTSSTGQLKSRDNTPFYNNKTNLESIYENSELVSSQSQIKLQSNAGYETPKKQNLESSMDQKDNFGTSKEKYYKEGDFAKIRKREFTSRENVTAREQYQDNEKASFIDRNENKKQQLINFKYSYFQSTELISQLKMLQQDLEEGNLLKCNIHKDYSTLYDTVNRTLRCPLCVFDEKKYYSNNSTCWGGFGRITPAKSSIQYLKRDIQDWEKSLLKKNEEIDQSIQTVAANQEFLRSCFNDEQQMLKNNFDEIRQRLILRENQLSDQLSKRYSEENEHLKLVTEELQPISEQLRKALRHFKNNTQLDDAMNLYYYHTFLRVLKDNLSFLRREEQQLYKKTNTSLLSINNLNLIIEDVQKLGNVSSFIFKGLEDKIASLSLNQKISLKGRSMSPNKEDKFEKQIKSTFSHFVKTTPRSIARKDFELSSSITKHQQKTLQEDKITSIFNQKDKFDKYNPAHYSLANSGMQIQKPHPTGKIPDHSRRLLNQSYLNISSIPQRNEMSMEGISFKSSNLNKGDQIIYQKLSNSAVKTRSHKSIDFSKNPEIVYGKSMSPRSITTFLHHGQ